VQRLNRSRGFLSKGTRHKIESIGFRETQGVRCKTATSSSSDRTEGREGHSAGSSGGHGRRRSGRPRVRPREELEEEVEGSSRTCSPAEKTRRGSRKMAGGDVDGRVGPPGAAALRWTPGDEERCNTCGSAPRSSRWRPLAPMVNRAGESGKATGGGAPRGLRRRRRLGLRAAGGGSTQAGRAGSTRFIGARALWLGVQGTHA
jgi:hypothetical protein